MNNKSPKKPAFRSPRQFSWSGGKGDRPVQGMIEDAVLEWHEAKHGARSEKEIAYVNSKKPASCPYCGGLDRREALRRKGRRQEEARRPQPVVLRERERRGVRLHGGHGRNEDERESRPEGLFEAHRVTLDAHTRRGILARRADRGARP